MAIRAKIRRAILTTPVLEQGEAAPTSNSYTPFIMGDRPDTFVGIGIRVATFLNYEIMCKKMIEWNNTQVNGESFAYSLLEVEDTDEPAEFESAGEPVPVDHTPIVERSDGNDS